MKKPTIGKLQKDLWEHCKRIIRDIYKRNDGTWICYTCDKIIRSKVDAHTSHFIPKSICGAFLKYDLRNLRVTCFRCNIWLSGNQSFFYRNLVRDMGKEYVDQLFIDQQKSVKAYDHYLELLTKYKEMI